MSVTKYGEKGKNENATTLKTDSIKHAELPACMLMLEGHYLASLNCCLKLNAFLTTVKVAKPRFAIPFM